jgi:hypothetical protein
LIRAADEAKTDGEAIVKSVVVPLDGSELAESVLPTMLGRVTESVVRHPGNPVLVIRAG